jgi:hypothetical protein
MTTEKMIVTLHFTGGSPLVIGSVPTEQAQEFAKAMTEDVTLWRLITDDEGLHAVINRDRITWIEMREDHREPKTPADNCYVRHEVAPGVHQDIPHQHDNPLSSSELGEQ